MPRTCGYCGKRNATTMDHVVPKCVFIKPLPQNMVTIPACEKCNSEKAKYDDVIRDIVAVDFRMESHPKHIPLFEKVRRSVRTNRSRGIEHSALDQPKSIDITTGSRFQEGVSGGQQQCGQCEAEVCGGGFHLSAPGWVGARDRTGQEMQEKQSDQRRRDEGGN